MNIRIFVSTALLSSLAFASCKKDLEPQETSAPLTAAAPTTSATSPQVTQQVSQPQPGATNAAAPKAVSPQEAAQMVAKGINPPHGQAGHRCDIAVGASLSTPVKTISPTVTQQRPTANAPQLATVVPTAKGMNPAHGQPGHRCDIAVGAPLNSPAKKATPVASGQTAASGATSTPIKINGNGEVVSGSSNGKYTITTTKTPVSNNSIPPMLQTPVETKPAATNTATTTTAPAKAQ